MHHQSTCNGKIWQYRVFGCLLREYIWIMNMLKKPCCCCTHGNKSKSLTLPINYMLQIFFFPQSSVCSRNKKLAKKPFTQTSDNLVNRISSSEFKCEDKQKYLVCKMYKYRQQSLFQKRKGMEDIQETQHPTNLSSEKLFPKFMNPKLELYEYLLGQREFSLLLLASA